jgi:HAD superfamily hydrolase (TIGR01549 family)
MASKPIKAVIWDLDGTLIHFKINFMKARREAFKILKKYGIPKQHLAIQNGTIGTIMKARKIFESKGLSRQEVDSIIKQVNEKVAGFEHEAAIKATMIKGIDEVLHCAKKNNLKQAIYTFNTCENAQISLEKVNLLEFFDVIAGRDNVNNPKPHPDHLLFICEKLGVEPTEIVVVGDHARDIEGAINVGAHSIGILSKLARKETLQIADVVVEEKDIPLKLIQIIKELS